MININDIFETVNMISEENLDIRTITMGISLLDCCDENPEKACEKIYNKITRLAGNLVKVGEDIERMKFNTAIAELMKLVNTYYGEKNITRKDYEVLIKLLYPFAPHITEELNSIFNNESLVYSSWPVYEEEKTVDNTFEMIVQVNGKLRDKIVVKSNITKEEMESISLSSENVKKFTEGKEVVKVIVVPNKLVNIVIK